MGITPDKDEAAKVGLVTSMIGMLVLGGGILYSAAGSGSFLSWTLISFGIFLTLASILVLLLPAAYDFLQEHRNADEE